MPADTTKFTSLDTLNMFGVNTILLLLGVFGFSNQLLALQTNPKNNLPTNVKSNKSYKIPPSIMQNLRVLKENPLSRIITNTYDFFYWLPRRNLLWDVPTVFWRNSTIDYIRWYQFPHNLPPYRFLDDNNEFMKSFFCYGLPGNTLPLGNWDPFGFQLVSEKVVLKYRESEIKHGRLSMLSAIAILVQENYHPIHPDAGGLAITQMDQLIEKLSLHSNFLTSWVPSNLVPGFSFPVDYFAVLMILFSFEAKALFRNWNRWLPNEYNHQFDHNIGVGNLKDVRILKFHFFFLILITILHMYSFCRITKMVITILIS